MKTIIKRKARVRFVKTALLITALGILSVQNASAAVVEMTANCTGPDNAPVCDTFKDTTIDASKIERVELSNATFDDSGQITITSPSGRTSMIPSSGRGCLQNHGYEDITELFTEKTGTYKIHIEANNDCNNDISAYAFLRVTYLDPPCQRTTSPRCDTPGPCEEMPGKCVASNGQEVCVYQHTDKSCDNPGTCQIGPGKCVAQNGRAACQYNVSPDSCNADSNDCTYDFCKASTDGLSATCTIGPNVCGGMIPCGRLVDDPSTPSKENESCGLCHLALVASNGLNFIFDIVSKIALLALIITALLFILSGGNPQKRSAAKAYMINVFKGYAIVFLAWLIVDFILSAWGFMNPIEGNWSVVCSAANILKLL